MSATNETRVAVVTGSSRGLGAAMARRLGRDGFFVVVNYLRSEPEARAVAAEVVAQGGRAAVVQGDVSTVAGVDAFFAGVDAALEKNGLPARFDVLVANAGIIQAKPFAETTEADFDALFNTNVKGVFFLVQRALPRLRDHGRVITLGSGLSRVANPVYGPYSATKGAIDVLTRVWAKDLGARGITVNTLAPGPIDTDMNPWLRTEQGARTISEHAALGRVGHADDIGDALAFLAGPDSRWVTAQRIEASGGLYL